jgi:hypothetical protein
MYLEAIRKLGVVHIPRIPEVVKTNRNFLCGFIIAKGKKEKWLSYLFSPLFLQLN